MLRENAMLLLWLAFPADNSFVQYRSPKKETAMKTEKVDLTRFSWLNKPETAEVKGDVVKFATEPETDFWQRTHYGFRRNNGHAFLTRLWDDFSFSMQCEFVYESQFDQAGLFLYLDEDNWAKASLEYNEGAGGFLGSVVTNHGYSDWGTSPLDPDVNRMYYRISRRGADFRMDCSSDGDEYAQMRIFHMYGDLSTARVGVYACSPQQSSFKVRFTELYAGPSVWVD